MGINSTLYVMVGIPYENNLYYEEGYTKPTDFKSPKEYVLAKDLASSTEVEYIRDMDGRGYIGSVLFESDDGRYGPIEVNETIDPIQLIFKIDKVKSDLESLGFEKPSPKLLVWMCYT